MRDVNSAPVAVNKETHDLLKVPCSYQVSATGKFVVWKGGVSLRDVNGVPLTVNKEKTQWVKGVLRLLSKRYRKIRFLEGKRLSERGEQSAGSCDKERTNMG